MDLSALMAAARKAAAFFIPVLRPANGRTKLAPAMWLAAGAFALVVPAQAQSPAAPARVALCAACHGADGNSALALSPSLAGQPRVFLENTLIMIREGLRPIAAMQGVLNGVSDAEIEALADHFSRQPVRTASQPRNDAAFRRGEALASSKLCGTCHLPNYSGQQQMPRLAAQREDYLVHTMREFRDNKAQGRDTQMNGVLRGYSDGDIADLAHYFAQLR